MSQISPNKVDIITVLQNNSFNRRTHIVFTVGTLILAISVYLGVTRAIDIYTIATHARTTCRFIDNDAREKLVFAEDGPCPEYSFIETWVKVKIQSTPSKRQEEAFRKSQEKISTAELELHNHFLEKKRKLIYDIQTAKADQVRLAYLNLKKEQEKYDELIWSKGKENNPSLTPEEQVRFLDLMREKMMVSFDDEIKICNFEYECVVQVVEKYIDHVTELSRKKENSTADLP